MKNYEKYPKTEDALEAYEHYTYMFQAYRVDVQDFATWLKDEYSETLLDAAMRVEYRCSNLMDGCFCYEDQFGELKKIIDRELHRSRTNFERHGTPEEAIQAFRAWVGSTDVPQPIDPEEAAIRWCYSEANHPRGLNFEG